MRLRPARSRARGPSTLRDHAQHALAVVDERDGAGVIVDIDAFAHGGVGQVLHEAGTAAVDLQRHAPEEAPLAVHHRGLRAVVGHEAHALAAQPHHCVEAGGDEDLGQLGVGAKAGHAIEIVEELVAGVAFPVGVARLLVGDVDQLAQIIDAVIGEAHHAAGEAAVAARLVRRRGLQHGDRDAAVSRRKRSAQGGVALADDDDIV